MAALAALAPFIAGAGATAAVPTTLAGIGTALAASTATVGAGAAAAGGGGILAGQSDLATIAGAGVTAVGQIASGQAQAAQARESGRATAQAAEFEAAQLDIRAKEERAASIQEKNQIRRQKQLALSKGQARAAASGFEATDPTSLAKQDEIERFGTLQEQFALFGGESRASSLKLSAEARRFSGASALSAGNLSASALNSAGTFSAGGTILGGVGSIFNRFSQRRNLTTPSSRNHIFGK